VPTDLPPAPRPESGWAQRPARAARTGLASLGLLVPVAALIGWLVRGRPGLIGALLGAAVPALVLLLTWAAVELGRRRSAQAFAGLLMGSYVVKLVAVGALLVLLRRVESADRTVLGLTAVIGLLAAVAVEAAVITRTRAPYVEP